MTKVQKEALAWLHKVKPWGRSGVYRIQTFRALKRRGFIRWGGKGWVLTEAGLRELPSL